MLRIRIQGSGIGCLFDHWIRDPGWEKVIELGNIFCALFKVKIPKFFDEDLTFIFTTQVETPQQEREREQERERDRERDRERFCFICLNDDQQLN